ncbi:unknown [Clostridium sp. CAG:914]|nr:unknown [Clostridium sp. CAG:914]
MENSKGRGIFLGVVSVATLIVAIIGATFAWFSASVNSGENDVNLTAYQFDAELTVDRVFPTTDENASKKIIPFVPDKVLREGQGNETNNMNYALNEATDKCVDSSGYLVCSLYKITVTNNGSDAIELDGTVTTMETTPTETGTTMTANGDLKAQIISYAEGKYTYTHNLSKALALPNTVSGSGKLIMDPATLTVGATPGANTAELYVLVWLNDSTENQSSMMGASYKGQFIFSAVGMGTGNKLTGTFKLG